METTQGLVTLTDQQALEIAEALSNVLYALGSISPVSAIELMDEDEYYVARDWEYRLRGYSPCKCGNHYACGNYEDAVCEDCERHL